MRATVNYWLAWLLLLVGLGLATTGFTMWLGHPHGPPGAAGAYFLPGTEQPELHAVRAKSGLGGNPWREVHQWLAVAFVALVTVHIGLHWKWLVAMTDQVFRGKAADDPDAPHKSDAG